ncbi:hypothetical protein BMW23_0866 [Bodo saltans virus]|uniref:Uncharacterized protein n=1 Tax=Bodo saltans virus TaxID=2024608 RepID=A0A2H4UVH1_9VIRU|nr:hypothetical protein QJ851_gp0848 [Bodo saltans virus]ATZ80911.1 hypothetical protein BMW23_0866 [Bodo saltans virus]
MSLVIFVTIEAKKAQNVAPFLKMSLVCRSFFLYKKVIIDTIIIKKCRSFFKYFRSYSY